MIKRVINKLLLPKASLEVEANKKIDLNNPKLFFFVHIPKTAGSSFRTAFERDATIFKDYGNNSKNTTSEVQQCIHKQQDFFSLKKHFVESPYAWLVGHIPLAKYINFVPAMNTVSFVREPVEQVISHYNHYVRYHGFEGDLSHFLDKPFAKNIQSKSLKFMPLGLIGCIGITEYYDDSLALINQAFGLQLETQKVNVNKVKSFTGDLLDETLNKKFKKHNRADILMYEEALYLHRERVALKQEGKAWTYGYANINQHNKLHGCAYQQLNKSAVKVVVKINGTVFKSIVANEFFAAFVKANFPRDRYIGFSIDLPKNLTTEDNIDIYVEDTGQKLNFKPLHTR